MSSSKVAREKRKEKGKATGSGKKEPRKRKGFGGWLRENLEAVFVAFVLALLIRHFSVEAFKIPTGSMQPTLYGDETTGDRILVFKPLYFNAGPERWDVMVFRYPLDTAVNYIKRCIGLPGDHLRIFNGDIWVDGKIAKKPDSVQEHLWDNWPVYPRPGSDRPLETFWKQEPPGSFRRVDSEIVGEAAGEATIAYPMPITLGATAGDFPQSPARRGMSEGSVPLTDVRLTFEARPATPATVVLADLRASDHLFRAEIPAGAPPRILHGVVPVDGDDRVPEEMEVIGRGETPGPAAGERGRVDFHYVDGGIHLEVEGVKPIEIDFPVTSQRRVREPVRIGVRDGRAAFSDVRIDRDLYHLTSGPSTDVEIPEGHYFALGDNTLQSADSRRWMRTTVQDAKGNVYEFDEEGKGVRRLGRTLVFTDVHGQEHRIDHYTILKSEPAPFIPEEYIVGKAFFTFFPPFRDGRINLGMVY